MNPADARDSELAALRAEVAALEQRRDEQRGLEQEMLYAEEKLRAILDATRNAVALLEGGIVIEVNQRFTEMFGYMEGECLGKGPLFLVAPAFHETVLAHIRSSSEEMYEVICVRNGGE